MPRRRHRWFPRERKDNLAGLQHATGVFGYAGRAIGLVWSTSRPLTITIGLLTLCAGLLPAAVAWVGKLIVDGVVTAADTGLVADRDEVVFWILVECGLVALMAALQRGLNVCNQLLRALLGHRVNVLILEKALELDLAQFEDAEFYDKLVRARREASSRPLSLITRTFGLIQNLIKIAGFAGILLSFSAVAVLILALAAVPAFVVETRFARSAFRLFSWRTPETRQQNYLGTLVAREDFVKEISLFALGWRFLDRYVEIFHRTPSRRCSPPSAGCTRTTSISPTSTPTSTSPPRHAGVRRRSARYPATASASSTSASPIPAPNAPRCAT